jgi:hypothetical protein
MLKVKADTNMTQKTKDRQYDGRSRPTNDLYKKNFDRIFGKKEKTTSEVLMEGFIEEQKMYEDEEKNKIDIDYDYLDSLKKKQKMYEEQANIQSDNLEMEKLNGCTKETN